MDWEGWYLLRGEEGRKEAYNMHWPRKDVKGATTEKLAKSSLGNQRACSWAIQFHKIAWSSSGYRMHDDGTFYSQPDT